MAKATKVDANTWHYRGFTIASNFYSEHGTGRVCSTQRGYAVTPHSDYGSASGIKGKWEPSISAAVDSIDTRYRYYSEGRLSQTGRMVIESAMRIAAERGEPAAAQTAASAPSP